MFTRIHGRTFWGKEDNERSTTWPHDVAHGFGAAYSWCFRDLCGGSFNFRSENKVEKYLLFVVDLKEFLDEGPKPLAISQQF